MKHLPHSRTWHRIVAATAASAMVLTSVATVAAQETHYTDVAPGVWYEESAAALLR